MKCQLILLPPIDTTSVNFTAHLKKELMTLSYITDDEYTLISGNLKKALQKVLCNSHVLSTTKLSDPNIVFSDIRNAFSLLLEKQKDFLYIISTFSHLDTFLPYIDQVRFTEYNSGPFRNFSKTLTPYLSQWHEIDRLDFKKDALTPEDYSFLIYQVANPYSSQKKIKFKDIKSPKPTTKNLIQDTKKSLVL
ncbi:hypothetical protein V6R21_06115 [Limibacter armeniacum]|uniref:hypothetical protein n=1 Tax=Limibacter armeniacum TaxID=466084 RepID=UPI002FE69524